MQEIEVVRSCADSYLDSQLLGEDKLSPRITCDPNSGSVGDRLNCACHMKNNVIYTCLNGTILNQESTGYINYMPTHTNQIVHLGLISDLMSIKVPCGAEKFLLDDYKTQVTECITMVEDAQVRKYQEIFIEPRNSWKLPVSTLPKSFNLGLKSEICFGVRFSQK